MGSYYIPSNNLKGENRILYIFTGKSLIYTAIGGAIGGLFYFVFNLLGLGSIGLIFVAVFALLGYGIGTIKMPTTGNSKIAKNVGGESIDEIVMHYIAFKKKKKVYTYAIPRKEPEYIEDSILTPLDRVMDKNTKEDK